MSEMFEGYERQYCELSTNLLKKSVRASTVNGEQKKQKVQDLRNGLEEAESLIRRMDLEARSLPPAQKAALLSKLREYKADLTNLKREAKKASSDPAQERDDLLETGKGTELSTSMEQRDKLLSNTARLQDAGDRIQNGRRTLLETEDLGISILQDLHQQRQTLLHARDSLHGVDDNVGRSRQILNSMARRMSRNKWIMGLVIAVLLLAIVLVVYAKIRH